MLYDKEFSVSEIARYQQEQKDLVLDTFQEQDAWDMGVYLQGLAHKAHHVVGISISLNHKRLFQCLMPHTAPLSEDWLRRKENTVYKFYKSSFEMAHFLDKNEQTVHSRYGLPLEDYAIAGGGVPITLQGVGVVGAVAVTGLSQENDHGLAVAGLLFLKGKA